jgi:branched-chain amino acid transport system ATP-binding protein
MSHLLEVRDLHARYGNTHVLHGLNLDVAEGQVTALLGANGAGKTTTLRALCQLMVQTTGSITLDGVALNSRNTEQIARLGVGHVPDGRGTFMALSTEENLRLGAFSRASREGLAEDMDTLSGGEQQMLAIGRALMGRPRLLLLDEPSFGLAPLVVKDIFAIMRRINQEEKVSILLVEQNAKLALDIADTAYLLETGRVVLHGSSGDMRSNDAVRRAYLGE